MPKRERRKTPRDTDRLKSLAERLARLISEAKQLRAQLEAVRRDPLSRSSLLKPRRRAAFNAERDPDEES